LFTATSRENFETVTSIRAYEIVFITTIGRLKDRLNAWRFQFRDRSLPCLFTTFRDHQTVFSLSKRNGCRSADDREGSRYQCNGRVITFAQLTAHHVSPEVLTLVPAILA
jgi:hypothetical protein